MTAIMDVLAPIEQEGTKAVVRAWLKRPGDTVAVDDPLVELETDKVTQEVPAPAAGILEEILLQSGEDAGPGVVLARIRAEGERGAVQPVADPSVVAAAARDVPGIMRYSPAVHSFRRTATRDTEIRGVPIREDDKVILWYPSANRDEEVFEAPDRFDIRRSPNDHVAFGYGEHYCLGANLARMELQEIFRGIAARIDRMEMTAAPRRLRSNFINGVKEMRVRFRPDRRSRSAAA